MWLLAPLLSHGCLGPSQSSAGPIGTPPAPTPHWRWSPTRSLHLAVGPPHHCHRIPQSPRGHLPVSLSQQRKTSLDGNCRRVVTATLLQDFTRNPAFWLKMMLGALLALAHTVPNLPGLGPGQQDRGMESPHPLLPGSHPACPRWGWEHGVQQGPGDGGCCLVGEALGRAIGAAGAVPQGLAGRGAGGVEGTLSWARLRTWRHPSVADRAGSPTCMKGWPWWNVGAPGWAQRGGGPHEGTSHLEGPARGTLGLQMGASGRAGPTTSTKGCSPQAWSCCRRGEVLLNPHP